MAKRECSKGHKYDSAIYGDNCPFCPSGSTSYSENMDGTVGNFNPSGTEFNQETERTHVVGGTRPTAPVAEKKNIDMPIGGTVIRPAWGADPTAGKKIVGFLVTYSASPLGKSFNIYEGRNYVGRDITCDVCITSDSQISGKHFSILFRAVDSKFKFKDEQSSNGTIVNDLLEDDGELKNFDVIRIGDTKFIFIAIPQIF
jgi:hypothetical protein